MPRKKKSDQVFDEVLEELNRPSVLKNNDPVSTAIVEPQEAPPEPEIVEKDQPPEPEVTEEQNETNAEQKMLSEEQKKAIWYMFDTMKWAFKNTKNERQKAIIRNRINFAVKAFKKN